MKYIVSWYETNRMLTTNRCQTFKNKQKALEYYAEKQKTKKDMYGHKIHSVCLSVKRNPNMDIVSISMDQQPWYDWVAFQLANGEHKKGKVEIVGRGSSQLREDYFKWQQAVRQLLSEKYGYNINFIPTLTEEGIKQGKITFGNF